MGNWWFHPAIIESRAYVQMGGGWQLQVSLRRSMISTNRGKNDKWLGRSSYEETDDEQKTRLGKLKLEYRLLQDFEDIIYTKMQSGRRRR